MLVFVYGTLKRGFYNHGFLSSSVFVGVAATKDKYPMINVEEYFPYLINDKNKGNYVKGEIFEINGETLLKLDVLEGYPSLYNRENIELKMDTHTVEATVYFLNRKIDYSYYELLEEFID